MASSDRQEPHQFTCTLGHAVKWKETASRQLESFQTVLSLVDEQGKALPDSPCLGFACCNAEDKGSKALITFRELRDFSVGAAVTLQDALPAAVLKHPNPTVGLLAYSSLDFVLTWLGLMRLGCRVFLLAPQLSPPALDSLCASSGCHAILVDRAHKSQLLDLQDAVDIVGVPEYPQRTINSTLVPTHKIGSSDIAFIQHSSGTSSGIPKPISTTHWGAVGALPRLYPARPSSTFSTTPLYHGGLADCLRAWTSGEAMWFFPEGAAPITASNIISAVGFARKEHGPPVANFSSVPYVLQLLADTNEGVELLRSMDIVGVGGAALPDIVGDRLVQRGVRLISRMGSAECGFLMSSERDFEHDKDWQHLRPIVDEEMLRFEEHSGSGGLFELVVRPKWPLRTKTNREDGSYATADLFEVHPSIPNAWRYHSRADSQIALANGKKFDPAPLESAIQAASPSIRDVLVFGAGKDEPGALILVKENTSHPDVELLDVVWPHVEQANLKSSTHSRLSRSMLVVRRVTKAEVPLEKSSKGTIMRHRAEARYSAVIDEAYSRTPISSRKIDSGLPDEEVAGFVADTFRQVLGRPIKPEQDLYQQGVDSIACTRIRKTLESSLLPAEMNLPLNVVYDQGTIHSLTQFILGLRNGEVASRHGGGDSTLADMRKLAAKYSAFDKITTPSQRKRSRHVVVLTGSTGALGAHILDLLLEDPVVEFVFCLVRADSIEAARARVRKALSQRGMAGLGSRESSAKREVKACCVPCALSENDLGLSAQIRKDILQQATVVIHAAWTVNFSLGLRSFIDHIAGTRHALDLARNAGAKFYMVSSTASVARCSKSTIPETASIEPCEAAPVGYAQSKWVAEQVCHAANKHSWEDQGGDGVKRPMVSVIRVGQLCSNKNGFWNSSEAYPLILASSKITGCLPDFGEEPLNWLPVDQAAQVVLDIALQSPRMSRPNGQNEKPKDSMPFYHVLNPSRAPTWHTMLEWIHDERESTGHEPLEIMQPKEWIRRLEQELQKPERRDQPSQGLLGFWQARYSTSNEEGAGSSGPSFEVGQAQAVSQAMRNVQPLNRDSVVKMWKWVIDNVG